MTKSQLKSNCCVLLLVPVFFPEAHHRFTEDEADWGFTHFIPKKAFYSEEKGKRYLVDDTMTLGFSLRIMKDPIGTLWHNFIKCASIVSFFLVFSLIYLLLLLVL